MAEKILGASSLEEHSTYVANWVLEHRSDFSGARSPQWDGTYNVGSHVVPAMGIGWGNDYEHQFVIAPQQADNHYSLADMTIMKPGGASMSNPLYAESSCDAPAEDLSAFHPHVLHAHPWNPTYSGCLPATSASGGGLVSFKNWRSSCACARAQGP
jgi:hypothetical protein